MRLDHHVGPTIQQGGRHASETLLRISGEMDVVSGPELSLAIRQSLDQGRRVVVDLTEVTFMDSSGIASIFLSLRDEAERDRLVIIPSRHPQPARLAELTGLTALFGSATVV